MNLYAKPGFYFLLVKWRHLGALSSKASSSPLARLHPSTPHPLQGWGLEELVKERGEEVRRAGMQKRTSRVYWGGEGIEEDEGGRDKLEELSACTMSNRD